MTPVSPPTEVVLARQDNDRIVAYLRTAPAAEFEAHFIDETLRVGRITRPATRARFAIRLCALVRGFRFVSIFQSVRGPLQAAGRAPRARRGHTWACRCCNNSRLRLFCDLLRNFELGFGIHIARGRRSSLVVGSGQVQGVKFQVTGARAQLMRFWWQKGR